MKKLLAVSTVAIALSSAAAAQDKNWKKALEDRLKDVYPVTKITLLNSSVKEPGVVLTLQQGGFIGDRMDATGARVANIRNGQIDRTRSDAGEGEYIFKESDKLYVQYIDVADDNITIRVLTVDPIERTVRGTTKTNRYKAALRFHFDKGSLATANYEAITKAIAAVLSTSAQVSASKTIELGQTPEQVEKILGTPENIIKLGEKMTYVYKSMKVIFMGGKVSDVQ